MGCCHFSKIEYPSGLIVPDQEISINELELTHPFSLKSSEEILKAFFSSEIEISEQKFKVGCIHLKVHNLQRSEAAFSQYVNSLKSPTGKINVKHLLLSGILLSNSTWKKKLHALILVYRLNRNFISQLELSEMFKDIIFMSTSFLPSLALTSITKESLDYYINKLLLRKSILIEKLLSAMGEEMFLHEKTVFKIFERKQELQRVFWANGIRMMLLEEDVKNLVNFSERGSTYSYCEELTRQNSGFLSFGHDSELTRPFAICGKPSLAKRSRISHLNKL